VNIAAVIAESLEPIALRTYRTQVGGNGGATVPAIAFHRDSRIGRLLVGGNKSARSTAGAIEAVWWLLGIHSFRKTPRPPVYGRAVVPKLPGSHDAPHPLRTVLQRWMPLNELRGGSRAGCGIRGVNSVMAGFVQRDRRRRRRIMSHWTVMQAPGQRGGSPARCLNDSRNVPAV